MSVELVKMTRDLMHRFYQAFSFDAAAIPDGEDVIVYKYDANIVNQRFDKHLSQGKQHYAIILNGQVIGDIYLKHIDSTARSAEMGIHIVNDKYKNKGYGTCAEKLLLQHAFCELGLDVVYANTLIKNKRSERALIKAGFREIDCDNQFSYFKCRKDEWMESSLFNNSIIA